jgi:voltage-gated potassium channel
MTPASHQGVFFLVLRRLRAPLITLIVIMAVSTLGLTLAPGTDASGQPGRLSFFHAFYFMSYTATTIGFGEIPVAFSEQQRLWVIICIYLSVVGWAYTLGTVFALFQDHTFLDAVRRERFTRAVRRLGEPFYLICGYGETGRLICQSLDRLGLRAVVVEKDPTKAGEVDLHEYVADIPVLTADASLPEVLRLAGLTSRHCKGVMALTNDDQANLAVAISARLLAPKLPALCRVEHPDSAANMASFGTRHIINPFDRFGEYLALALHAPHAYHLLTWLTGVPGTTIRRHRDPPRGPWVLCGYGSFGAVMVEALDREAVPVTIIDRTPQADPAHPFVAGDGTGAPALLAAGIQEAVGIVASTASDMNNLSIVVTARELNPKLFTVLRQNRYANRALFDAFDSDVTVVSSEIVAHECLAILTTPLLVPFLEEVQRREEAWSRALLEDLTARFGWDVPAIWSVRLNLLQTPAVHRHLMRPGTGLELQTLMRNPYQRDTALPCAALYLRREGGVTLFVPPADTALCLGDELLFIGMPDARLALALTLENANTLAYVRTGEDLPGGWLWERLARRRPGPDTA